MRNDEKSYNTRIFVIDPFKAMVVVDSKISLPTSSGSK